ncbi:MAG TPA: hypothetical protein VI603_13235 [Saprospiraceae bacterium]|nr:hypothetical protein [Saprospiraceae bacterium]
MKAQRIKRLIGLILLGAFLAYFGNKLINSVDNTLLVILILAIVVFVVLLVAYVLNA